MSDYKHLEISKSELEYRIMIALEKIAKSLANYDHKTEPSFKVDGIGDDDPTIHAIAYLQKVGWLQEHDRALTEPSNSEKPNNCEHITEDGVTCAKYPACDDCLDNPLNKVKGSERLVKGSEQTDCQTCKWWSSYGYCVHRECQGYEPQAERSE